MRPTFSALVFGLSVLLSQQALAAERSCKEALDAPASESEDAAAGAGNIYGPLVQEIDGTAIKTPDQLYAALKTAGDKTPLISGGDFSGWDFSALKFSLAGTCFFESKMQGSDWSGVDFPGLGLIQVDLEGSRFRGARLDRILLREPGLKNVSMAGARLRHGHFDGGWGGSVTGWNLTGADMQDFTFDCSITVGDGCPLDREGVKFVHADLTNADISSYVFWGQADYAGAILDGTRLAPRQLPELVGANVKGPIRLVGGEESVSLKPNEVAELQRLYVDAAKAADQPSFDCAKAASKVEKMICSEYETELRRLDRQLAELYTVLRPKIPSIAKSQIVWLKKRNACIEPDCLHTAYTERVTALLAMLNEPQPIKPGEVALYIYEADRLGASPEFRTSDLYRKIVPVLIGASMGEVLLSRNADGSYDIVGESVGANAHLCSVGGDSLRYDPKTGWFSGPREGAPSKLSAVFRIYGDQIEFPGNGHPDDAQFPGSEDYASCGMRAALIPMTRIEADAALIAKRQAIYETERN